MSSSQNPVPEVVPRQAATNTDTTALSSAAALAKCGFKMKLLHTMDQFRSGHGPAQCSSGGNIWCQVPHGLNRHFLGGVQVGDRGVPRFAVQSRRGRWGGGRCETAVKLHSLWTVNESAAYPPLRPLLTLPHMGIVSGGVAAGLGRPAAIMVQAAEPPQLLHGQGPAGDDPNAAYAPTVRRCSCRADADETNRRRRIATVLSEPCHAAAAAAGGGGAVHQMDTLKTAFSDLEDGSFVSEKYTLLVMPPEDEVRIVPLCTAAQRRTSL